MATTTITQEEESHLDVRKFNEAVRTLRKFLFQASATSELISKIGTQELIDFKSCDMHTQCGYLADSLWWTIERKGGPLDALETLEEMT